MNATIPWKVSFNRWYRKRRETIIAWIFLGPDGVLLRHHDVCAFDLLDRDEFHALEHHLTAGMGRI